MILKKAAKVYEIFKFLKKKGVLDKIDVEGVVDSAEAGVLKKMEELKNIELSERDKKIAVMIICAIAGLGICSIHLVKKHKKKMTLKKKIKKDVKKKIKKKIARKKVKDIKDKRKKK